MRYWIICNLLLLNFLSPALADYTARLAQRGIVFSAQTTTITEAQLCSPVRCIYVEPRELALLNMNLGDDAQTIFKALNTMSELEKAFLFSRINHLQNLDW